MNFAKSFQSCGFSRYFCFLLLLKIFSLLFLNANGQAFGPIALDAFAFAEPEPEPNAFPLAYADPKPEAYPAPFFQMFKNLKSQQQAPVTVSAFPTFFSVG